MKRINVILPEETIAMMDRVTKKGLRSRFIDEAVRKYLRDLSRTSLRKRLEEGAKRRAERDLELANDWFPLEEEAWQTSRK